MHVKDIQESIGASDNDPVKWGQLAQLIAALVSVITSKGDDDDEQLEAREPSADLEGMALPGGAAPLVGSDSSKPAGSSSRRSSAAKSGSSSKAATSRGAARRSRGR